MHNPSASAAAHATIPVGCPAHHRTAVHLGPWVGAVVVVRLAARMVLEPALRRTLEHWRSRPGVDGRPISARHVRLLGAAAISTLLLGGLSAILTMPETATDVARHRAAGTPTAEAAPDTRPPADQPPSKPGGEPAGAATDASGGGDEVVAGRVEEAEAAPATAPNPLPTGKGMWFHRIEYADEGPRQIIEKAKAVGLTHLYVRLGSSKGGFYAQRDLDTLLPLAHDAGLKVVGWDFPYLDDPVADAERARAQIAYTTGDGHRIDAFSADIETSSEGVALTAERVETYGKTLRGLVGVEYPLVATVPNACLNRSFPYDVAARHFDAIAPMVYWINRDPGADVACNMDRLSAFGKPVLPIGQAYDPAIDNPAIVGMVPRYEHLDRFMTEAATRGAAGVSFWVWHTATPEMWHAVADAQHFTLVPMQPRHADPNQVAVLQRFLRAYGEDVPVTGRFGGDTSDALRRLQAALGLEQTGALDRPTLDALNGPTAR